MQKKKI